MANTLYIVEDIFFTELPEPVRKNAVAEAKKILAFIPKFDVKALSPLKFPAVFDFTDSVIRVVADDKAIGTFEVDSKAQQMKNIRFSLAARGYSLAPNTNPRSHSFVLERAGVGWMGKEVMSISRSVNNQSQTDKVAITQTGGAAAVLGAAPDVLKIFAHGRDKDYLLAIQKKYQQNHPGDYSKTQHYKDTTADLAVWALLDKPLRDWPRDVQEALGKALGRIIAHEARHQYTGSGHADEGLGGESPELWGMAKHEQFSTDDQAEIGAAIRKLADDQKAATVPLAETNPKGQPFPF